MNFETTTHVYMTFLFIYFVDAGYVNTTITVFSGSGRACINYTNFVVDNDVALEGEQKFNIYVGDSSALVAIVDDDGE